MEEDQQAERFAVIEAPIIPQDPVRPKRGQLLLLVFGAAMGGGAATAFGAEFLDNTIRRSRDITQKLNTQLLVTIPYITTRAEARRRNGKTAAIIMGLILLFGLALAAVHQFYSPLDLLWLRAMKAL